MLSEIRQDIGEQMRKAHFLILRFYNNKDVYSYKAVLRHFASRYISEFVNDLKLHHPIGIWKYNREELIEKWEEKLK